MSALSLQLLEKDSRFALEVFRAQRKQLYEVGLNLWAVDKRMPRQLGSHDLVAEFVHPESLVLGCAFLFVCAAVLKERQKSTTS